MVSTPKKKVSAPSSSSTTTCCLDSESDSVCASRSNAAISTPPLFITLPTTATPSSSSSSKKGRNRRTKNYTSLDCLCGRDALAKNHPGNQVFKSLVRKNRETYRSLDSNHHKTLLAESIISTIHESGGRFMKRKKQLVGCGNDDEVFGEDVEWIELSGKEALAKTTQALREVFGKNKPPLPSTSTATASTPRTKTKARTATPTNDNKLNAVTPTSSLSPSSSTSSFSPETVPPFMMNDSPSTKTKKTWQQSRVPYSNDHQAAYFHGTKNVHSFNMHMNTVPFASPYFANPSASRNFPPSLSSVGTPTGFGPGAICSPMSDVELMLFHQQKEQQRRRAVAAAAATTSVLPLSVAPSLTPTTLSFAQNSVVERHRQQQELLMPQRLVVDANRRPNISSSPVSKSSPMTDLSSKKIRTGNSDDVVDKHLRRYVSSLSREELEQLVLNK
mmetsp:Transcript_43980/g.106637  ORF Transcript_43980/g.106637 Transcript_43980/m.106637 type:complete len:446 (-) Transcript_43980:203-1540(-)